MISALLLTVGLLFATFTQLRPSPDVPVGFGELCLAVWIVHTLVLSLARFDMSLSRATRHLLVFWIVFAAALCIGTMTAFIIGERNERELFVHDLIAYTMMASISLLCAFQANASGQLRRVSWLLVLLGSACLAAQLLQALGLPVIPGVEVWFYNRLNGWTTNSNQLGLLCLILVFLAFHLAETTDRWSLRLVALCGSILPIVAGLLTRSDAFVLSLAVCLLGAIGLKSWKLVRTGNIGTSVGRDVTVMAVVGLPLLMAAVIPGAYYALATQRLDTARLDRDIGFRTELVAEAMERLIESRLLGLGPGPHLVRPTVLREPQLHALPNFEAHNTVVDLSLQGGILAAAILIWLTMMTIIATLKANLNFLPMLIVAVCAFGLSHFVIRHPTVWFALTIALVASDARLVQTNTGIRRGKRSISR